MGTGGAVAPFPPSPRAAGARRGGDAENMAGVWAGGRCGGRRELCRTELAHHPGAGVLSNSAVCVASAGVPLL